MKALLINGHEKVSHAKGELNHVFFAVAQNTLEVLGYETKSIIIDEGYNVEKAIQNIIALHLNPIVDEDIHGNKAHCLSKGVIMDVVGANSFQLDKDFYKV
ncbi:hypothetical protein [Aquimarina spongiae]|uniref:Uncharacterized protein n=1 Tax=Aquimarina spongiae TaxID=570521 RepID=A0A1M6HF79_9FLAO|nr:hypothetical protein [Aquimarina spongiae]SHJ20803.1 hypothetical protein SAMN04488508_106252 [Aquimarina spongiae]